MSVQGVQGWSVTWQSSACQPPLIEGPLQAAVHVLHALQRSAESWLQCLTSASFPAQSFVPQLARSPSRCSAPSMQWSRTAPRPRTAPSRGTHFPGPQTHPCGAHGEGGRAALLGVRLRGWSAGSVTHNHTLLQGPSAAAGRCKGMQGGARVCRRGGGQVKGSARKCKEVQGARTCMRIP